MPDNQDVVLAVGGSIYLDVPEGRPSSVTSVAVHEQDQDDSSTALSATTGSAAVDSVETTLDGSAGASQANAKSIPLTATTSVVVGRQYLVTNAAGQSEWVEVVAISSGVSVTSRHPLQNDYASGATFVGTRISIALDSTWVSDVHNLSPVAQGAPYYRVIWTYVVGGVSYVRNTYFDVVRMAGAHNVTPVDMARRFPNWLDRLHYDQDADSGQAFIDDAYEELKLEFQKAGLEDAAARDQDVIDRLVMYKARQMAAAETAIVTSDTVPMEIAQAAFDRQWNSLIADPTETKIAMAQTESGAAAPARPLPISVR